MLQQLGRYRIEDLLGEGSFAHVYRATDLELERQVALKVLKSAWLSDPQAIGRFKQEARTMAKLAKNQHIAVVYDVGEDQGYVYLAQLLVDGETLAARLARGRLPWSELPAILRPVASALDYAHSQGVIHRDIKPTNILLDHDGQPYLADFGLVRAAEGSASLSASIGGVKGTAAYIPPEVWDGEPATPASDVYALSCVVFEMLTGVVLFEGSSMMAVMRKHDKGPQFPATWPPDIPAGVTEVLQRGLAKNPAERYHSAGELVSALAALSVPLSDSMVKPTSEPVKTGPPPATTPITVAAPDMTRTKVTETPPLVETLPPAKPASGSPAPPGSTVHPPERTSSPGLISGRIAALGGGGLVLLVIGCAIIYFAFIRFGPTPTAEPTEPIVPPTAEPTEEATAELTQAEMTATAAVIQTTEAQSILRDNMISGTIVFHLNGNEKGYYRTNVNGSVTRLDALPPSCSRQLKEGSSSDEVNPFRLFNLPCDDPRFCYWNGLLSPDDSKILGDYLDDSKAEPTTIGIGDIQEGNFIPILKPPRGSGIYYAWSPDSEKAIINAVIFEGNYDIFIVNADGSDLINLTLAIDESMQFANWSPDSSQILANNAPVERTGQYDIYVINIDGSSLTNLTQRSNESEVPICWLKE